MINTDEDALICDLAETYHIFDMRELPPLKVAVFSCGLRDNSRIKMKMTESELDFSQLLIATCADYLALDVWMKSANGQKNINRPKSLVSMFTKQDKTKSEIRGFGTPEEFNKYREEAIARIKQCQQ